jgi:hypothetical protein
MMISLSRSSTISKRSCTSLRFVNFSCLTMLTGAFGIGRRVYDPCVLDEVVVPPGAAENSFVEGMNS